MASCSIRRILCGKDDAALALNHIRDQLSARGNVVSERGRSLTIKVFGEPLSPQQVVERICTDVRERGLDAVVHYTEKLDGVRLAPETVRVTRVELAQAHLATDADLLKTVRRIRQRVMGFQLGILHNSASLNIAGLHHLQLRYRPIRRVGIMIPGGAAAYPSTLLMTVCPAQAAGVPELVVVMPPTANGAENKVLRAVCHELGVEEVYRIGGAQAVAALAYGIDGVKPVDMIVGPGNLFVALAKKYVFGQVGIDCIAGPSEVVVVADESAPPAYVAADLIAQAEHAPGASILLSTSDHLLDAVHEELDRQLAALDRGQLARESLEQFGVFVLARDEAELVDLTNLLAPEHLHIATRNAPELCDRIDNAGAIFLGNYTPVALGDYAAGPSHVLPTGSTARFASGLSANDFLRRSSVLNFTEAGMKELADDVRLLARCEGLTGHAASVDVRLTDAPLLGDNSVKAPRQVKTS